MTATTSLIGALGARSMPRSCPHSSDEPARIAGVVHPPQATHLLVVANATRTANGRATEDDGRRQRQDARDTPLAPARRRTAAGTRPRRLPQHLVQGTQQPALRGPVAPPAPPRPVHGRVLRPPYSSR